MTEGKLRELFVATNTEEPLAGGWPGLLRYGMAVLMEAKREALLEAANEIDERESNVYLQLRRMAEELK